MERTVLLLTAALLGGLLLTARADDTSTFDPIFAATSARQMVAQFIVLLVLVLFVGFFVYIFRARRMARAAGDKALAAFSQELGARKNPSSKPGLFGTSAGGVARSTGRGARAPTTSNPTCTSRLPAPRPPPSGVGVTISPRKSVAGDWQFINLEMP